MNLIPTLALSVVLTTSAALAQANTLPGLQQEEDINRGLLVVAVADKIRRECDSIGGRLFTARSYANALKDMASERGYSDDEIDAYINDKQNKAAMRERRNAYYEKHGASNLDPNSLCVLGRSEINKNSQIGRLLKAK